MLDCDSELKIRFVLKTQSFVQAFFCIQPVTKEGVKPSAFISQMPIFTYKCPRETWSTFAGAVPGHGPDSVNSCAHRPPFPLIDQDQSPFPRGAVGAGERGGNPGVLTDLCAQDTPSHAVGSQGQTPEDIHSCTVSLHTTVPLIHGFAVCSFSCPQSTAVQKY